MAIAHGLLTDEAPGDNGPSITTLARQRQEAAPRVHVCVSCGAASRVPLSPCSSCGGFSGHHCLSAEAFGKTGHASGHKSLGPGSAPAVLAASLRPLTTRREDLRIRVPNSPEFKLVETVGRIRVYANNLYSVSMTEEDAAPHPATFGQSVWHLMVRRHDGAPLRDWRDLQCIKNQLVGPEHEAVELYPAESRLVDLENASHLWVLQDAGLRLPWGFTRREVTEGGELMADYPDTEPKVPVPAGAPLPPLTPPRPCDPQQDSPLKRQSSD